MKCHIVRDVDRNLVVDDECNEYQKESVKSGDSTLASYFASFNPVDIDNQNETPVPFPHVSTTAMPDDGSSIIHDVSLSEFFSSFTPYSPSTSTDGHASSAEEYSETFHPCQESGDV